MNRIAFTPDTAAGHTSRGSAIAARLAELFAGIGDGNEIDYRHHALTHGIPSGLVSSDHRTDAAAIGAVQFAHPH